MLKVRNICKRNKSQVEKNKSQVHCKLSSYLQAFKLSRSLETDKKLSFWPLNFTKSQVRELKLKQNDNKTR